MVMNFNSACISSISRSCLIFWGKKGICSKSACITYLFLVTFFGGKKLLKWGKKKEEKSQDQALNKGFHLETCASKRCGQV